MKNQLLTSGSIAVHVRRMALPASIGLFFQTMYNVVDSLYAGRISTQALAAMGLSFPIYLLIIAAGAGISRGAGALVANAIGAEQTEKQEVYIAQSLSLAALSAVILSAVGLAFSPLLFRMLGAEGEYLRMALSYMNPIFFGTLFFVLVSICNSILAASGDTKTLSKVLIVGFFANLILDPWFLYGGFGVPPMGLAGIALATVLIQACSSLFMLGVVIRRGWLDVARWRNLIPNPGIYFEILVQAIPSGLNIVSVSLGFFIVNFFIERYGEPTVAAFGVTTRIEQIGLLPTFGIYSAIRALVGQNNGAGNQARVRETIRYCNRAALLINTITSIAILALARPLMRIFTADTEVIDIGVHYIRIMMLIQWSYVMTSTHLAVLQAIKRPFYGLIESVLRKVVLPAGLTLLLFRVFDSGVDSVWYGVAISNVLMTFVTIALTWQILIRIRRGESAD